MFSKTFVHLSYRSKLGRYLRDKIQQRKPIMGYCDYLDTKVPAQLIKDN